MKKLLFSFLFCFILTSLTPALLHAQNDNSITGKVVDEDGSPLSGATVQIEDAYQFYYTGIDGTFELKGLAMQEYRIKVTYVGYEPTRFKATPGTYVDVQLRSGVLLQPATVTAVNDITDWTPMSYEELDESEVESRNLGQDLPYLLRLTPSVVVTSDAGTGVGYTGIRVRGSDPTRINVTINGIPLNDAESQGTFWVDLPDFASSVDNIQIQRGVGTSTNGAGAFGASINLKTGDIREEAYGKISNGFGSFNTRRHSLQLGTGLIGGHFTVDGRLSTIKSDGFIDRATADLNSYYLAGAYSDARNLLRATIFSGHEVTYQAWGGVPGEFLEIDSLRTYNPYTYDNEVDDYRQDHYQLHYTRLLGEDWDLQTALHYTKGLGFFEQYREQDDLADYGLSPVILGGDTVSTTDLIRRRWLDNDFYGFTGSLNYDAGSGLQFTLGGGWNNYVGGHFGEIIWAEFAAGSEIRDRYYDNNAEKADFNIFAKAHWQFADRFGLYGDLQYRQVDYTFEGFEENGELGTQSASLGFFNPKAGVVYKGANGSSAYASFAVGGKEPNRSDYTESTPLSRPEAERLYDFELGYDFARRNFRVAANAYYMLYDNQLILTGQVNDVGAYTRTNVDNSYRAGLELSGAYSMGGFNLMANLTLSDNRILDFVEYVDNWDTWGQEVIEHGDQPLSFSPAVIAGSEITYDFLNKKEKSWLELGFLSKYVGKQYIDNTGSDERALDPYFVNDLQLKLGGSSLWRFKTVELKLLVRNLLDQQYESNAWVYRFVSGGEQSQLTGFYPQAGTNFLLGLEIGF